MAGGTGRGRGQMTITELAFIKALKTLECNKNEIGAFLSYFIQQHGAISSEAKKEIEKLIEERGQS